MENNNKVVHEASSGALLVAAIDFGTTYSGWACSFQHEFKLEPTKIKVKHWYTGSGSLMTEKTPTCALIKPDGKTLEAFGYEAENKYNELVENDEHNQYYLFKRFKMALHNKSVSRNLIIKDEMGRPLPAIDVFKLSIQYLSQDLLEECNKGLVGDLTMKDIYWVLTVPAIWSDGAKQFMREAAEKAGLEANTLHIALEPEAASVFCRHLPIEQVKGKDTISSLSPGSKYMVLDAGGGTIDITVHQVTESGGLKEISSASGGGWGGVLVDRLFEDLLIGMFNKRVYDRFVKEETEDWIELWRTFESKKKTCGNADVNLRNITPLFNIYKEEMGREFKDALKDSVYSSKVKVRVGEKLQIDSSTMKELFAQSIESTLAHVKSKLEDGDAEGVNTILMVGGFSEATLLQEAFKKEFHNRINIVVPRDAATSVLRGAVVYGHNPIAISQRILKKTYGTEAKAPFEEGVDPEHLKTNIEGDDMCTNVFSKHVEINQVVTVGEAQAEKSYWSIKVGQPTITLPVFASDQKNPSYTDEGCERVGSLTIDLTSVPSFEVRKGIKVYVSLTFSGTEITATGRVPETGQTTSATFDFLE